MLICSKDKDILQLLDHHIRTYDIKTGKITDSETMKQEMGIGPGQIVDCLALEGDAIDNVPGVPLIGEKTARELIRQYGDLDNLYAHADEIKGKRGENLRNAQGAGVSQPRPGHPRLPRSGRDRLRGPGSSRSRTRSGSQRSSPNLGSTGCWARLGAKQEQVSQIRPANRTIQVAPRPRG